MRAAGLSPWALRVAITSALLVGWCYVALAAVCHALAVAALGPLGFDPWALPTLYSLVRAPLVFALVPAAAADAALGWVVFRRSSALEAGFPRAALTTASSSAGDAGNADRRFLLRGALVAGLQAATRVVVLFGALDVGPSSAPLSRSAQVAVLGWGLTEAVRCRWCLGKLLALRSAAAPGSAVPGGGDNNRRWSRMQHTAFVVLYPLAVCGEIGSLMNALPFIYARRPYSLALPNAANFAFDFFAFAWAMLVAVYPVGAYVTFGYRLRERRLLLGRIGGRRAPAAPAGAVEGAAPAKAKAS